MEVPRQYSNNIVEDENMQRANHDVYTGPYDRKYMSRNRVRSWNELSFTIQAQAKNTPQHPQAPKMRYVSASERIFAKGYEHLYRRLSVRECARIQTFPDSFKLLYTQIEDGYKMVGNAVPPRLAYNIAKEVLNTFSEEAKSNIRNNHFEGVIVKSILSKEGNILLYKNNDEAKYVDSSGNPQYCNVLIGFVTEKNKQPFISKEGQYYYTGVKVPKLINFRQIVFFIPYIKGKGVRDLYSIKSAWIGEKKDIGLSGEERDLRIIFKLEFVKQLFSSYMPIHLNVWHTYTLTSLHSLYAINME